MNRPRKAKSRRLLPLPLDAGESKCGICLDEVVKRGKIGPCSHLYCFTCLLEWSRLNNTCPQCKLIFRSISRIDFATDKVEEKVFIKDKTLRTGHVSSEEEYYHINSSEVEDSDPDFIDYSDIPNTMLPDSDSEPEAMFTQRKRKCLKTPSPKKKLTKKRARAMILSDSESEEENDNIHESIISQCKSPDLFDKSPRVSSCGLWSPQVNESPKSSGVSVLTTDSPKRRPNRSPKQTNGVSPKSPNGLLRSPKRFRGVLASPKISKSARWASLDQKVKSLKHKRGGKKVLGKANRPGISIRTLTPGITTNRWLSTTKTREITEKENVSPKQSVNNKFKAPFKTKTSISVTPTPKNKVQALYEDPETYFANIINSDP